MPPLLLISVRDAAEAAIAVSAGADVIDVKEPDRGSLGRATDESVASILEVVRREGHTLLPVTMALGELRELDRRPLAVPSGVALVKLGLAGCSRNAHWRSEWNDCKRRCDAAVDWVAVIYADELFAESPTSMDVIGVAAELDCRGVLIDTYTKSSGSLLDFLDIESLRALSDAIHERGMFIALAGSLTSADLPRLALLNPDIIAVRGAVCSGGERRATVDARRIQAFREAMNSVWPVEWQESIPAVAQQRHAVDRLGSLKLTQDHIAIAVRGEE